MVKDKYTERLRRFRKTKKIVFFLCLDFSGGAAAPQFHSSYRRAATGLGSPFPKWSNSAQQTMVSCCHSPKDNTSQLAPASGQHPVHNSKRPCVEQMTSSDQVIAILVPQQIITQNNKSLLLWIMPSHVLLLIFC